MRPSMRNSDSYRKEEFVLIIVLFENRRLPIVKKYYVKYNKTKSFITIDGLYKEYWIIFCLNQNYFVFLDNILSTMGKFSINKLPSDILMSTASKAAALRKELKLTQFDLSIKSGVSYGSIKRFERSGQISFESLLKIAEALDRLSDFEPILALKGNKKVEDLFKSYE